MVDQHDFLWEVQMIKVPLDYTVTEIRRNKDDKCKSYLSHVILNDLWSFFLTGIEKNAFAKLVSTYQVQEAILT